PPRKPRLAVAPLGNARWPSPAGRPNERPRRSAPARRRTRRGKARRRTGGPGRRIPSSGAVARRRSAVAATGLGPGEHGLSRAETVGDAELAPVPDQVERVFVQLEPGPGATRV